MNPRDVDEVWDQAKVRDWSAEERYVNRSIRIRKHVAKWLGKHVGASWTDIMLMAKEKSK